MRFFKREFSGMYEHVIVLFTGFDGLNCDIPRSKQGMSLATMELQQWPQWLALELSSKQTASLIDIFKFSDAT